MLVFALSDQRDSVSVLESAIVNAFSRKPMKSLNPFNNLLYGITYLGQRPSPPAAPDYKVYPQLVGRAPCARARKQALGALTVASVGVYVPQCNPDGGFNQRQCHQSTGYCWCVDEAGREMPRTRTRGRPTCDKGK